MKRVTISLWEVETAVMPFGPDNYIRYRLEEHGFNMDLPFSRQAEPSRLAITFTQAEPFDGVISFYDKYLRRYFQFFFWKVPGFKWIYNQRWCEIAECHKRKDGYHSMNCLRRWA